MRTKLMLLFLLSVCAVSKGQNKFDWVTWNKVPAKTKNDLKAVKADKKTSFYEAIMQHKNDGMEDLDINFCALDTDKDGKMEYFLFLGGMDWCGSEGCTFEAYKNGGLKQIHLIDQPEGVRPAKNGMLSSSGKLIPYENMKF